MIVALVEQTVRAGARERACCETIGLSVRTLQRWRASADGLGADGRHGPLRPPTHKLSDAERAQVLEVVNSAPYRNLGPEQIVPRLADGGVYLCSEATMYRILRQADQLEHRGPQQPPTRHKPAEKVARGPNQVWSWDISYLRARVRGQFYYLYMVEDVFSRKIVGWQVELEEAMEHGAALLEACYGREGVLPDQLILHADNGGAMRGVTMLTKMKELGVVSSFSRPAVSNDNPYIESLFRTAKYRPFYPRRGFESLEAARQWFARFVAWYNEEHMHSAIGFVPPQSRHRGEDHAILAQRHGVYQQAQQRNPNRWTRKTRNWERVNEVRLNADGASLKDKK
jgi:putative transposase